jgi:hypothetical protein
MTSESDHGRTGPDLRSRSAAYESMRACLDVQATAPTRSRIERFFGRSPLHPDAREAYRGAVGELEVSRLLSRLDESWTVLSAVPIGGAAQDIDHVLIGARGVFTVHTPNHAGKRIWASGTAFAVNGQKKRYVHRALAEAERVSDLLARPSGIRVPVSPLIVVVDPASITGSFPDVHVVAAHGLLRLLKRQPRAFADDTVASVVQGALRRSTWGPSAASQFDIADRNWQFERLRADVVRARTRRHLWSTVARVSLVALAVVVAILFFRTMPDLVSRLFVVSE